MARIFISYSRTDEVFARRLAGNLDRLGADVWIDVDDIPAGMKWRTAIQQGLNTCEVMIVIISPDSMASTNVEDEWQTFLDDGKPVIPILLRPTDQIHFQLRHLQYIDFSADAQSAFARLVRVLGSHGLTLTSHQPQSTSSDDVSVPAERDTASAQKRRNKWLAGIVIALLLAPALVFILKGCNDDPYQICNSLESKDFAYLHYFKGNDAIYLEGFDKNGESIKGQRVENNDPISMEGHEISTQKSKLCAVFESDAFAVLKDATIVKFDQDDEHTLILDITVGGFIFEFGNLSTKEVIIDTPDGFKVLASSTSSSFAVSYDHVQRILHYACLSGDCQIREYGNLSNSSSFGAGIEAIIFTGAPNLAAAPITSISSEDIDQYRELCDDCVAIPTATASVPTRTPHPTAIVYDGVIMEVTEKGGALSVRSGAGFSHTTIDELYWGDRVLWTGETTRADGYTWYHVKLYSGRVAYIPYDADWIISRDPARTTPNIAEDKTIRITSKGNGCHLRSDPSVANSTEVQTLFTGNTLVVIGGPVYADYFLWWNLQSADGRSGWLVDVPGWWEVQ